MRHISELDPNKDQDILKIVMMCKGLKSKFVKKFSKNELQHWLFPIAMERPKLIGNMITDHNDINA